MIRGIWVKKIIVVKVVAKPVFWYNQIPIAKCVIDEPISEMNCPTHITEKAGIPVKLGEG